MGKARAIWLAGGVFVLGLGAAVWQDVPRWRNGGTDAMPAASVAHAAAALACPDQGAIIAIFGDSHVAGSRMEGGGAAFGVVLGQRLAGRAGVTLHGAGGDTAQLGEARWRSQVSPAADLVILAYGTNDAAPRGWLRGKSAVPIAQYTASLKRQLKRWQVPGRQVVLMAPPPGGSAGIAQRLRPYREAAQAVGRAADVPVLDPADAFANCRATGPLLTHDALHMNAAGHQCLGQWLAHQLCPPTR